MVSTSTRILRIIPGLQATALLGANLKAVKKFDVKSPKGKIKPLVKLGVTNLVGIGLIKATAKSIE